MGDNLVHNPHDFVVLLHVPPPSHLRSLVLMFSLCSHRWCRYRLLFWVGLIAFSIQSPCQLSANPDPRSVDFVEQIQPLLKRHCYRCHGDRTQEGGLRLDRRAAALGQADSEEPIIVQRHPDQSLLIRRIIDAEAGELMPLDGQPLTQREVDLLRQWIDQGAAWPQQGSGSSRQTAAERHWAYQPIQRPELPAGTPPEKAIDYFVNRKLNSQALTANPPMNRASAVRRVSLALIGLPPTPQQVQAFLKEDSEEAYRLWVDHLLASPRYGERWAVPWLDLARYADSNGFQADQIRDNWAYRDWVIRAFNQGMPFDEFVIDQLAGDLRTRPTMDQRIATGFHRMTTCNVEAGVHPEANRVNQVVDRVNTTATVFLGTTLECAQCHDHKYDPFSQKDYYRFFAYFNNTPLEVKQTSGVTWDFYGPKMDLPMAKAGVQKRAGLLEKREKLKEERARLVQADDPRFEDWLTRVKDSHDVLWEPVVPARFETTGGEDFKIQTDGSVLLTGDVPQTVDHTFLFKPTANTITAIRVELLTDDAIPGKGPGRGDAKRPNVILSELTCDVLQGQEENKVPLSNATADYSQPGWEVAKAIDGNRKTGWAIGGQFSKPHWATFVLAEPLQLNAQTQQLRVSLGQYFGSGRVAGKPRISITNGDADVLNVPDALRRLAARKKLSEPQRKKLRAEYERRNPQLAELDQSIAKIEKELKTVVPQTTLVMQEMESPRETFVMLRGDYEALGEAVKKGTPEFLPKDNTIAATGDRMELARWLTSDRNPLLARVTVNRWWSELFGAGLVPTLEDFGTQSDAPSHPLLLDWLASELIASDWSMKHIHELMVISSTFQRSAKLTQAMSERDPLNRYLARGPRFRLPAETIRDNALAISGLMSDKMYGPPIMPYQPANIWRSVGRNQPKWVAAENEDRFRRGAYVVWKRAAPYPSFVNFDAPDRGSCTVNRGRSNTPLQALTLLNDPAYVEMALAFADRVLSESPSTDDRSRLQYAMELAVARTPTEHELQILRALLESERRELADQPERVKARTRVPVASMKLRSEDPLELAAWFAVTNAVLNLDESMNQ